MKREELIQFYKWIDMNYALSMLCDEYDNIVDEYILSLSPVDKGEDMAAEEVLTKKCLENKVWLTSNERHTMLEAIEEYSALRKVEMPSEEDVDKEFPITSETKAVTLSYQANQMAKREGAKWAIEQIKHLNKL